MLRYLLLLVIIEISQGYLVFHPEELKVRKNLTSDTEYPGDIALSSRIPLNTGALPSEFDWRDRNVVSPVKDQAKCVACWAFSIVAAVESHLAIHTKEKKILSEQFLIDCDPRSIGCGKAPLLESYAQIVNHIGGVLRNDDYFKYEARKRSCRWTAPTRNSVIGSLKEKLKGNGAISHAYPVPVIGYSRVKNDEDAMAHALYNFGPLTAAINSASMATYKGGIDQPDNDKCDPKKTDHTVLIVGYGYSDSHNDYIPGTYYWIIKNSWGEKWGESGYYLLERGLNRCGIASDVSLPFVAMD